MDTSTEDVIKGSARGRQLSTCIRRYTKLSDTPIVIPDSNDEEYSDEPEYSNSRQWTPESPVSQIGTTEVNPAPEADAIMEDFDASQDIMLLPVKELQIMRERIDNISGMVPAHCVITRKRHLLK